jgi:hypothetical protein
LFSWIRNTSLDVGDLVVVAGLIAAGYGIWMIYEPAAFVFAGIITVLVGLHMSKA